MNSITKYKDNIEDVVNKLNNNINYFNNFGDAYIPLTLRNHLEEIVLEFNKVKAHDNNVFNDYADYLAKKSLEM